MYKAMCFIHVCTSKTCLTLNNFTPYLFKTNYDFTD